MYTMQTKMSRCLTQLEFHIEFICWGRVVGENPKFYYETWDKTSMSLDVEYLSLDVRMSSAYLQIFYLWLILSLKISPNNFCKFTKTPVAILRLFMMKDSLEISTLPLQSSLSAHVLWMVVVSIIFLYRKKIRQKSREFRSIVIKTVL